MQCEGAGQAALLRVARLHLWEPTGSSVSEYLSVLNQLNNYKVYGSAAPPGVYGAEGGTVVLDLHTSSSSAGSGAREFAVEYWCGAYAPGCTDPAARNHDATAIEAVLMMAATSTCDAARTRGHTVSPATTARCGSRLAPAAPG